MVRSEPRSFDFAAQNQMARQIVLGSFELRFVESLPPSSSAPPVDAPRPFAPVDAGARAAWHVVSGPLGFAPRSSAPVDAGARAAWPVVSGPLDFALQSPADVAVAAAQAAVDARVAAGAQSAAGAQAGWHVVSGLLVAAHTAWLAVASAPLGFALRSSAHAPAVACAALPSGSSAAASELRSFVPVCVDYPVGPSTAVSAPLVFGIRSIAPGTVVDAYDHASAALRTDLAVAFDIQRKIDLGSIVVAAGSAVDTEKAVVGGTAAADSVESAVDVGDSAAVAVVGDFDIVGPPFVSAAFPSPPASPAFLAVSTRLPLQHPSPRLFCIIPRATHLWEIQVQSIDPSASRIGLSLVLPEYDRRL